MNKIANKPYLLTHLCDVESNSEEQIRQEITNVKNTPLKMKFIKFEMIWKNTQSVRALNVH